MFQAKKHSKDLRRFPVASLRTPIFLDVPPDHTFYNDVMDLYEMGAINGYPDGTFRVGDNATRAHVAKISVLAHRLEPLWNATQHFTDVPPTDPFFGYIERAYADEWVSGYEDDTFRPGKTVTRGQIAKISVKASRYSLITPTSPPLLTCR